MIVATKEVPALVQKRKKKGEATEKSKLPLSPDVAYMRTHGKAKGLHAILIFLGPRSHIFLH